MLALPLNHTDHLLGPANANIELIAYVDFECPYSRQAFSAIQVLLENNRNQIRFAIRHFPIATRHRNAQIAAEAAEVAGAQNKFWPMAEMLFEHQRNLSSNDLRKYATRLGLDIERYDYEMNCRIYFQRIREQFETGSRSLVRATPTFFVNGEMLNVSFEMEHLKIVVESKLDKRSSSILMHG